MTDELPRLGFAPDAPGGEGHLRVDLDRLVAGRMLIQGNSGAGKSWLIRYLLEQTYGAIPHLVLDPEGEFYTLRERFGYVWAGAGDDADVPLHPDTAKVMARRFVEVGASVVLDLYELPLQKRREFIARFCQELVHLPKRLWKPVLIVLDEAHQYAPQRGQVVSSQPVIDLCTLGRKRGFTPCLATQRLSKIDKDAAAVLQNKFVGRTDLDTDVRRAADHLGLDKDGRQKLRHLEPGTFFTYGPAIDADGIVLARSGDVETTHPEPGKVTPTPPPPPDEVTDLLGQLEGMAEEAEEEERTLQALEERNRELREKVEFLEDQKHDLNEALLGGDPGAREVNKLRSELREDVREELEEEYRERIAVASHDAAWGVHYRWEDYAEAAEAALEECVGLINRIQELVGGDFELEFEATRPEPPEGDLADVEDEGRRARAPAPSEPAPGAPDGSHAVESRDELRAQQREILDAIAQFSELGTEEIDSRVVAAFVGLSPGSSWCKRHFQELVDGGLIRGGWGSPTSLRARGRRLARSNGVPPSLDALHNRWLEILRPKQGEMLREVLGAHPRSVQLTSLADAADLSADSSWFTRHLQELEGHGLVERVREDRVRASDLLFPEELD